MIVYYCDICERLTEDGELYRLKLWKGSNVYGFEDICPACAGSIKNFIEDLKYNKGAEE